MARASRIRQARPPVGRPKLARESILDLNHAIKELEAARDEIAYVDATETSRHRIAAMLVEPLARLELVARFCRDVKVRLNSRAVQRYAALIGKASES
jgi:hypothetical protein